MLGDYSNYHACLADGLRRQGHYVAVASDGSSWMNTARNISLRRPFKGLAGGALLFFRMMSERRLRGYDVVSLINPSFVTLKPRRLREIFDLLKRHNGRVFLSAVGTDKAAMDMYAAGDCPLRYSEYFINGKKNLANEKVFENDLNWCRGEIGRFCEFVYDNVAGVTTALYEYDLAMRRRLPAEMVKYVGIPIDLNSVKPLGRRLVADGKVRMFLGRHRHRMAFKGTDVIGRVAEKVVSECPGKCSLDIVENLPYSEYIERLKGADLVLDQLYSYTPATNALLAMAEGQAVLSGGEPEFYDFIGERNLRPVINAEPDEQKLYCTLKNVVENHHLIIETGAQGREFVRKHNDADLVAARCVDFWQSNM